jgi:ribosomal protein S6
MITVKITVKITSASYQTHRETLMSTKHRIYEMIYLVNRDASDEERERLHARLESAITADFDGQVLSSESWGKRRLAYEIKKGVNTHSKAHYLYLVYSGIAGVSKELERILRLNDITIRFMTIRLESYTPQADVEAPMTEEAQEA